MLVVLMWIREPESGIDGLAGATWAVSVPGVQNLKPACFSKLLLSIHRSAMISPAPTMAALIGTLLDSNLKCPIVFGWG